MYMREMVLGEHIWQGVVECQYMYSSTVHDDIQ